jgi:hypothetical protein
MQMGVLITLTAAACIGDLSSKEAIGFSTLEANFMGNVTPLAFHVLGIGVRMFFLRRFARADCPVRELN